MSAAAMAMQQAVVAALTGYAPLMAQVSGVFDGPPVRARLPWIGVDCGPTTDWSHKTATGREVRVGLSLWHDGDAAGALHDLMMVVEDGMAGLGPLTMPWRLVHCQFVRSRVVRDPGGPWLGLIDYRARILAD